MMILTRLLTFSLLLVATLSNAQQYAENAPPPSSGIFGMLQKIISPPDPASTIDMPDCLITLNGGIDVIDKKIAEQLDHGNDWVTLVTTRNDQTSIVAVKNFYNAVRTMCGEASSEENIENVEEAKFDINSVKDLRFAHLSFDNEGAMTWHWMIWKVPLIVFVTKADKTSTRLYDLRYWKIAWNIPSAESIIASVPGKGWLSLPVWDSIFAPGEQFSLASRYASTGFDKVFSRLEKVPSWILAIIGSFLGSLLLAWLHKDDTKKKTSPQTSKNSQKKSQ